jgi:hypothetical protein
MLLYFHPPAFIDDVKQFYITFFTFYYHSLTSGGQPAKEEKSVSGAGLKEASPPHTCRKQAQTHSSPPTPTLTAAPRGS